MLFLSFTQSCGCKNRALDQTKRLEPVYNKKSGRLEELKYDSNGDGKFDTFSYMDGATILRIEIDQNEDGKIDRWEYYGPGQKLENVGFSRAQDGIEDAWQYFDRAGAITRVEMASTLRTRTDRASIASSTTSTACSPEPRKTPITTARSTNGKPTTAIVWPPSRSTILHRGTPTRELCLRRRRQRANRSRSILATALRRTDPPGTRPSPVKSVLYLGCPATERAEAEALLASANLSIVWAEHAAGALAELQKA